MKYTKGEWEVNIIKGIRVQNEARCICLVGENDEEDRVNAHLIAAAPDMYEALKFFVEREASEYEYLDKGIGIATDVGKAFLSARKTLAKAEGR